MSPGWYQDLEVHRNSLGGYTKVLGCRETSWGMPRDLRVHKKNPEGIHRDLGVHKNPPGGFIKVLGCTELIQGDAPRSWGAQNPPRGCTKALGCTEPLAGLGAGGTGPVTSPLGCPKLCCGPAQPWAQHNPAGPEPFPPLPPLRKTHRMGFANAEKLQLLSMPGLARASATAPRFLLILYLAKVSYYYHHHYQYYYSFLDLCRHYLHSH